MSSVSDVTVLADRVREARARRMPLRIVAGGTWLDAGQPCDATERLEVAPLSGIVTYEPGDLTLTARSGTPLSEIERVTAAEGQWLTLDPHAVQCGASLGATIATASYGPLASAFGTPRDHVLGCEFVSGTGDVVRAGGRVVKNVAGFDLVRLVTGAWGTLGVLTEATLRLRARPEMDRTLAVRVPDHGALTSAHLAWHWLRSSEYSPLAAELMSPSLARQLGLADAQLLVRLGGNEALVRAAETAIAALGESVVIDGAIWNTLRSLEPAGSIVLRVSTRPAGIGALWERVAPVAEQHGGFAHATLTRGAIRCCMTGSPGAEATRSTSTALAALAADATVVGERMPAALWNAIARPRSTDRLAAEVRRAFDPDGIMNPGIMGGR